MANENQQNEQVQQPLASADSALLGARGASRRRFARAGAGATGVLMTLASQPGMACSISRSPSGYQSVMTSKTISSAKPRAVVSAGWPPSRWYANLGTWKTTKFGTAFSCANTEISNATAEMLLSLYKDNSTPAVTVTESSKLAMWLVAAYLNVQYQKSTFLTVEILQGIWNEFQRNKSYTPTAGVKPWTYADIIVYLSGTMD